MVDGAGLGIVDAPWCAKFGGFGEESYLIIDRAGRRAKLTTMGRGDQRRHGQRGGGGEEGRLAIDGAGERAGGERRGGGRSSALVIGRAPPRFAIKYAWNNKFSLCN